MSDILTPTRPALPVADLQRDLCVHSVTSHIVDVPTVRRHKLSSLSVAAQSYVIVRVRLDNGVEGIGEAATLGGPRWSEECVEGIKATIDAHLAPALTGVRADAFELAGARLDAAAKRNNAAKAALETALFDAVGRSLGLPVAALLGGAVRECIPVLWTLASGDAGQELEEAEAKLAARLHDTFKVKIGAQSAAADLARLGRLAAALAGRARLIVDANQAWDETTANRCTPALAALGIELLEQPLPAWNLAGLARVRARSAVPLLADESVFTPQDMLALAQAGAADAVSLKLVKHGGLLGLRRVAAVAEAAGVGLYGGCLLESSIGAAAHLHAFAGLRELAWGCEHFGPQILTGDLVTEPLHYADGHVHLPSGPGLGLVLDEEQLRRYARR
ncbi:muconate/chloromuconate family cycloisomerase [Plasticicumulans sp.]|uniref:muconate/chloromuconate family cycloisomerase n=1 Tax=Plasticicumulans sp. TaxID=2307179 RepID=UPI002BEB88F0|nr:muconate/chloromuconate family cycloisomerase [Plasticicumulans sp.]HNF66324.1 muconate/chloromuconate family cycloisomerase [Plasticicumulans sp.]